MGQESPGREIRMILKWEMVYALGLAYMGYCETELGAQLLMEIGDTNKDRPR
jgi:hypothetical protein